MKRICVLIPAYNEAKVIEHSLVSCWNAGIDVADIYVVNDGSTDATEAVALALGVQVLSIPNGGKAYALKTGADHFGLSTHYTHVAILDADSAVDANYFQEMRKGITQSGTYRCGDIISEVK